MAHRALVAQWIERSLAEAEVVSSSLTERAIILPSISAQAVPICEKLIVRASLVAL